jgi:hypothetical protein
MPKQTEDPNAAAPKVLPADPALRRELALVVILLALIAAAYFGYLLAEIERVRGLETPDPASLLEQLRWMSVGLVGVVSALLIYLVTVALRVFSSGQFPPPGARVLNDTPIRRGSRARVIALSGVVLGLLALAAALYAYVTVVAFVGGGLTF